MFYVKTISAVIGLLIGIVTIFSLFNIPFPRPLWHSEIRPIKADIVELDNIVTSQQLDDAKLRLYQNEREQIQWAEEGPAPEYLVQEKIILERKIDNLDNRLDNIREIQKSTK